MNVMKIQVHMSVSELELLIEALARAASRHESYSRFNPRNARVHDRSAVAMRDLRKRLLAVKMALPT